LLYAMTTGSLQNNTPYKWRVGAVIPSDATYTSDPRSFTTVLRTNLPVTTVEYPLTDETIIVSKTDLKGKLTYFNAAFVAVAGFTEAELAALGIP